MSKPIRDFMTPMPHTIGKEIKVGKTKAMMAEHNCHNLPVLNGGHLVGIVSDTDVRTLKKIADSDSFKVEDIMTEDPEVVSPQKDVFQVAMLMHQKRIGSVIVSASDESPWGIFTATDALKYLTQEKNPSLKRV